MDRRRPGDAAARDGARGDLLIETHQLTKRYGDDAVVDGLDLRVRAGEVYGFLGPNGAGKTTTLRMLLGLVRATSGAAAVLGREPGAPGALRQIGALVESPGIYPHLSGRENLRVLARYAGAPEDRIDAVLRQVRLHDRADDRVRGYSLGMRQRLGVAAALLKDPRLVILDEPSNGLDPAGMAEMRELIRSLGSGGRTVVLSSHLMQEVEQVCDRVGIINRGVLVAEGTTDELRGRAGLVVATDMPERAVRVLTQLEEVRKARVLGGAVHVDVAAEHAARLNRSLVEAGIAVSELRVRRTSLEDVFFGLTRSGPDGGDP